VYHFAAYEPAALKRLMLRYAKREDEVDRLLRGEIFVDLHVVAKQSVRASVEQYSLKALETFCKYRRRVPLPEASQARHFVEHQLELTSSPSLTEKACRIVERYNEDDYLTAERLRGWLGSFEGLKRHGRRRSQWLRPRTPLRGKNAWPSALIA
jgi:predicted RecB family nuclease